MNYQKLWLFVFLIAYPYQNSVAQDNNLTYLVSGVIGVCVVAVPMIILGSWQQGPKKPDIGAIKANIEDIKSQFAASARTVETMVEKINKVPVLSDEILQRYDQKSHQKLIHELQEQKHTFSNLLQENSKMLQAVKKDLNSWANNAHEDWFVKAESFIKEAEASLQKNELHREKFVLMLAVHKNIDHFVQAHYAIKDMPSYRFFDIICKVKKSEKFDKNFILSVYPTCLYPMVQAVEKIHAYKADVQQKLDAWSLAEHNAMLEQMHKKDTAVRDHLEAIKECFEVLKNTQKQIAQLPGYENELKQHTQWKQSLEEARSKQQIELEKAQAAKLHEQSELKRLEKQIKEQENKHEEKKLKQLELTKRAESERKRAEAQRDTARAAAEQASFQANAARYAKEQEEVAFKKIEVQKEVQKAQDEAYRELSDIKGFMQRIAEKVERLQAQKVQTGAGMPTTSNVGAGMKPENGQTQGDAGMASAGQRGAGM